MEIKTIIYPKQEQAYYDAVEREDWYAANLFYMPPIYRAPEQIESDMRFQMIVAEHEAEQQFINELPNELLETYIKIKFKIKDHEKKRVFKVPGFWSRWLNRWCTST